jgi:ribulose-phosphate 3-epimerase
MTVKDKTGDNKKYKISMSILDSDFMNLSREIDRAVKLGTDMLHIDVMDGHFVPNISIGQKIIKLIKSYTPTFLDVHLMVKKPSVSLDSFIECQPDLICIHAEESVHLTNDLGRIKKAGIKAAVALNPSTPVCILENVLSYTDMVLIMTVNPGFGGQKLLPECLFKIKNLVKLMDHYKTETGDGKSIDIQVDGGINPLTAKDVVDAGANVLVLGSAFFKAENPADVMAGIRKHFNSY